MQPDVILVYKFETLSRRPIPSIQNKQHQLSPISGDIRNYGHLHHSRYSMRYPIHRLDPCAPDPFQQGNFRRDLPTWSSPTEKLPILAIAQTGNSAAGF